MPTAKRVCDLLVAGAAIVLLAPVMAAVAVCVRVGLGSPVFFRQRRLGLGGKPFEMVKFRSMRDATDRYGQPLPDEARLTRFGKLLRASSLDELPELWNVLRGEMSLVGPRPLLPQYRDLYTPEQFRRHDCAPGITGWAQVNGRNAVSWDRKFALDLEYVDNRSLWLDAKVLLLTVWKVIRPSGVSQSGEATTKYFDAETSRRVVVFGAGGHAAMVIQTLRKLDYFVEGIYDDAPGRQGQSVDGVLVVGTIADYAAGPAKRGILAIGDLDARRKIAQRIDCHWLTAIDPDATVAATARFGVGTYVAAGAVVQHDVRVGEHGIVNSAASVHYRCRIGDFVHLSPGCTLVDSITVGDGAWCGYGSVVLPGAVVAADEQVMPGTVKAAEQPATLRIARAA